MSNFELIDLNLKLFNLINSHNHPFLDMVFYLITYLGSGLIIIPTVLILYKIKREKILPVVSSYLISGIAVQVMKYLWSVPRPAALFDSIHVVGETLRTASFPSGHTATAMALFYVLSKGENIRLKTLFLILALSVGFSRVYVGAHFPLDILVGGIVGYLSGYISMKYNEFFYKYKKELFVVFFIPAVLFFYRLDAFPFYIVDEARNAEAAREMLTRSDLLVPTYNYELRTDKPPLHYWVFILGYKLLGVNELSTRIGSAIIGLATVLLVYLFTVKVLNRKIALISASLLPTCLYGFLIFRMAVPDPYLVFFSTLALFSFYLGIVNNNYKYILIFYISIGLAVLTKGPVGFILPFGVAFAFIFFREMLTPSHSDTKGIPQVLLSAIKSLKVFLTSRHIIGFLIAGGIAIPWYVIVSIKTGGEFASGFFLHHNIGRFLTSFEGPKGPFFALLFLLLGFFPWSFFTIQVLISSYKEKKEPLMLFLFLWVILHLIFYSISATKLPQYLIPVYPALSILTAKYLSQGMPYKRVSAAFISIFGLSAIVTLFILGNKYAKELMPWVAFLGLPFLIGGIFVLFLDKYIHQTIAASTVIFFLLLSGWLMPMSEKYFIPKKLAHVIEEQTQKSGAESINNIYSYKYYDPAFEFYIRKKIIKIKEATSLPELPEGALLISTENKLKGSSNFKYRQLLKVRDPLRKEEVLVVKIEGK
jgi:4-amino-4-deoxy-L-arabinose transferase-like glycosyltransferase/membrane-associated phospholipid phosphatase